jgi:hypothetical protein
VNNYYAVFNGTQIDNIYTEISANLTSRRQPIFVFDFTPKNQTQAQPYLALVDGASTNAGSFEVLDVLLCFSNAAEALNAVGELGVGGLLLAASSESLSQVTGVPCNLPGAVINNVTDQIKADTEAGENLTAIGINSGTALSTDGSTNFDLLHNLQLIDHYQQMQITMEISSIRVSSVFVSGSGEVINAQTIGAGGVGGISGGQLCCVNDAPYIQLTTASFSKNVTVPTT